MLRSRRLRFPLCAAAATAIALCVAGPASAHIDPEPASVQAGTEATVGFNVEHGCDGSPTTKLELQFPDGSSGLKGVDVAGFTASVSGQIVTFAGGSLPPDQEQPFQVTFTAPPEAGEAVVKIIQTCEEGSIDWISLETPGGEESEHPAAVITLTPAAAGSTTTTASATASSTSAGEASTTTQQGQDEEAAPTSTSSTKSDDDDSDSSAPLIIGIIAAVVVLGGGGALYARSRKTTTTD